MAYTTNQFCWHGIITTDTEKATTFYGNALPFSIVTTEMGGDNVSMVAAGDIPRAHIAAPPAEGIPSHWEHYLRVDDVDASTAAAEANGGQVLVPPTDIPPGRFSAVASPSGAVFNLFHEADEATAANPPAGAGSVHWTELHSKDVDADLAWLTSSFGFDIDEMPMPDGPYFILKSGDAMCGGVMAQQNPEAPAMWLPWIEVTDVDATLSNIDAAGGRAVTPLMDVPTVGRMAVVADPTGGVFGVITPAAQA